MNSAPWRVPHPQGWAPGTVLTDVRIRSLRRDGGFLDSQSTGGPGVAAWDRLSSRSTREPISTPADSQRLDLLHSYCRPSLLEQVSEDRTARVSALPCG